MSKMTVLIVDDEAPARKKLARYVNQDTRFELVGEAVDGPGAVEQIQDNKPDLVLLDIQMPGMTGIDVLHLLEAPLPAVIFATAYDQFAVQAFELCAVDYLLKPIGEQRIQQALDKAITGHRGHLEEALTNLKQTRPIRRLPVRFLKRVKLLDVDKIAYIHSEHRMVTVYDDEQNRYWTNETLDQLMARLPAERFFRIHRGSIINLAASFELESWEDGRMKVHFPWESLVVAREPAGRLKKILKI